MASITIRRLDDSVKARLRVQAARKGHSMEEEARAILTAALEGEGHSLGFADRFQAKLAALGGGFELPEIPRPPLRKPPRFGK